MVAVYVSYVGKDSAILNKELNWVKDSDSYVSGSKLRLSIASHIRALVFWIGPEDLSCDLKKTLVIFYAYDTGITMGRRIANINTILNVMWIWQRVRRLVGDILTV